MSYDSTCTTRSGGIVLPIFSGRSLPDALHLSFLSLDHSLRSHLASLHPDKTRLPGAPRHPGCTACVAVLVGRALVVANAGDCRAVLGRTEGPALQLTTVSRKLRHCVRQVRFWSKSRTHLVMSNSSGLAAGEGDVVSLPFLLAFHLTCLPHWGSYYVGCP